MNFTDAQTSGTTTVNVTAEASTSITGNISYTSPNETVSGFSFGAGGSFSFNAGNPGGTALNLSTGSSGGSTVKTNVFSTPSTLSLKITAGLANRNVFDIGAAPDDLGPVAGPVTIVGDGTGTDLINLLDQGSTVSANYTVTSSTVTSTGTFGGF